MTIASAIDELLDANDFLKLAQGQIAGAKVLTDNFRRMRWWHEHINIVTNLTPLFLDAARPAKRVLTMTTKPTGAKIMDAAGRGVQACDFLNEQISILRDDAYHDITPRGKALMELLHDVGIGISIARDRYRRADAAVRRR